MSFSVFKKEKHCGYVVGNGVLSAEVTDSGRMFQNVRFNPSCFSMGKNQIRYAGECGFFFESNKKTLADCDLNWSVREKTYPKYVAEALFDGLSVQVRAFAPITPFNENDLFLPAVIVRFSVTNETDCNKKLRVVFKNELQETSQSVFFGFSKDCGDDVTFNIEPNSSIKSDFCLGIYDKDNEWRTVFKDEKSVQNYLLQNSEALEKGVDEFISLMPQIGNKKIDEYIRWYSQAAILLTKSAVGGNVITMGYHELNQRDSFWTSFLHLVLYPGLERRMIEISIANQTVDGKIPTTLLPVIERKYDVDINEYFCLRIARYYRFYGDKTLLKKWFASYKKSVEFIFSVDKDGDFLPEQEPLSNPECFWYDWKDVPYIKGRKLAPHVCLLWLAVLKEGAFLAEELSDSDTAIKYKKAYAAADKKINSEYTGKQDGGMWDKDHYAEIWYDEKMRPEVLQDQTVGIFFDVIPKEKISLIYSALDNNRCECGIRETYPYRNIEKDCDEGGVYHNGGVWPWLMFCDIAGRYKNGFAKDAEKLFEVLGYYDLELPGDFRPNEYLNGESNANCGLEVQGWSAAAFGTVYFGAFEIFRKDEKTCVKCNLPKRKFSTKIVLPNEQIETITCDGEQFNKLVF